MTVKENLIAAKALIDTHWAAKDISDALDDVVGGDLLAYQAARTELMRVMDKGKATSLRMFSDAVSTSHADVMDLFDRAIAAQESQP